MKRALPLLLIPLLSFAQVAGKEAALPTLAPLVESVKGAVVNVDVQARREQAGVEDADELFGHFFGRRGGGPQIRQGSGSGFIVDPRGLILTNNHVVEGAINIKVRMDDGRSYDAEVVGRDPLTDVALIKLKGKVEGLPVVKLGDSGAMRPGDWVVAIGNPFGLASSVSLGIISALDRNIHAGPYDQFLQTDAAINPGNSGGPLFNLKGEVIGINTAIVGGGTGLGFAVPSNVVKALAPQLEKDGSVTRGWLGVAIKDLRGDVGKALGLPVTDGALITSVNDGSPAQKGGLKEDDVVVAVDGEKVNSGTTLSRTVAMKRPDSTIVLSVYREGQPKPMDLKVKLGTRPDLEKLSLKDAKVSQQAPAQRLKVGLSFQDMEPRYAEGTGLPTRGALVVEVQSGSPAENAGLRRGMVIVEANKKPVMGRDDLSRALAGAKPGSLVLLRAATPGGPGRELLALEMP